jgi:hypothetical protein
LKGEVLSADPGVYIVMAEEFLELAVRDEFLQAVFHGLSSLLKSNADDLKKHFLVFDLDRRLFSYF